MSGTSLGAGSEQRYLVGVLYFAVGMTTGTRAGAAASSEMQFFWRLSAFIVSGVVRRRL